MTDTRINRRNNSSNVTKKSFFKRTKKVKTRREKIQDLVIDTSMFSLFVLGVIWAFMYLQDLIAKF